MTPPLVALLQHYLQRQNIDVSLGGESIPLSQAVSDTGLLPGLLLGVQQQQAAAQLTVDLGFDLYRDEQSMFGVRSELAHATGFEQYYFRWAGLTHYLESLPRHENTIELDQAAELLDNFIEHTDSQQWSPA